MKDDQQTAFGKTNVFVGQSCSSQAEGNLLLASGEPGGSSSSTATGAESAKPKKKNAGTWLDTLNMNPRVYWPKKYRYTMEPVPGSVPILTVRERDHYESNGYIVVRNLIPKETQQKLSKLLTSAETVDQALSLFAKLPQILRLAECFCGPNLMAMHKGCINHEEAAGTAGTEQTLVRSSELSESSIQRREEDMDLHQDLFSLPFRPADRIVCALTPILPHDDAQSAAAVSFLLAQGSHRSSQMLTIDDDSMIIYEPVPQRQTMADTSSRKQLQLNSGDTIFYHPLLSHSEPMFVTGSAAASLVSCHYASSECEYVIMSGHETLVPAHLKPISRIAVHPENKWKDKALLVKGKRITL